MYKDFVQVQSYIYVICFKYCTCVCSFVHETKAYRFHNFWILDLLQCLVKISNLKDLNITIYTTHI